VCGNEATFQAFENAIESEFAGRREEIEERKRERIRRIAEEGLRG
jgi:hypothetical protein